MIFRDELPIYIQIMNLIKIQIVNGEFKSEDKLLSVRDLAKELKVNPNTVQRAYQELELEGLVETKRGMGTFIKEDDQILEKLKNDLAEKIVLEFLNKIKNLGFTNEEIVNIIKKEIGKEN